MEGGEEGGLECREPLGVVVLEERRAFLTAAAEEPHGFQHLADSCCFLSLRLILDFGEGKKGRI